MPPQDADRPASVGALPWTLAPLRGPLGLSGPLQICLGLLTAGLAALTVHVGVIAVWLGLGAAPRHPNRPAWPAKLTVGLVSYAVVWMAVAPALGRASGRIALPCGGGRSSPVRRVLPGAPQLRTGSPRPQGPAHRRAGRGAASRHHHALPGRRVSCGPGTASAASPEPRGRTPPRPGADVAARRWPARRRRRVAPRTSATSSPRRARPARHPGPISAGTWMSSSHCWSGTAWTKIAPARSSARCWRSRASARCSSSHTFADACAGRRQA